MEPQTPFRLLGVEILGAASLLLDGEQWIVLGSRCRGSCEESSNRNGVCVGGNENATVRKHRTWMEVVHQSPEDVGPTSQVDQLN